MLVSQAIIASREEQFPRVSGKEYKSDLLTSKSSSLFKLPKVFGSSSNLLRSIFRIRKFFNNPISAGIFVSLFLLKTNSKRLGNVVKTSAGIFVSFCLDKSIRLTEFGLLSASFILV